MSASTPLRVVSLLPVLGHPRDSKRIAMLKRAGASVRVVAFERDYHTGRLPDAPVTSLGKIPHGRYLSRAVRLLRALPVIRGAMRECDAAYASGPDMALAAIVAGAGLRRPVVLEVGDLRRVQVAAGPAGWLMRTFDRFIANRSTLLVCTARGFAEGYYRDRLGSRIPVIYAENKLDFDACEALARIVPAPAPTPLAGRRIRIGWFGVLRCEWSWSVLSRIAREHGDRFEVVIAGLPLEPADLADRARDVPNLRFLGPYRSPQDLPGLYGAVDLVWACYPGPEVTDPAWRWALAVSRSNRFYEACHFRRPLVTVAESGDGQEVDRLGIGLNLLDQRAEAVVDRLRSVRDADIAGWAARMAELPRSAHVATDEGDRIVSHLVAALPARGRN